MKIITNKYWLKMGGVMIFIVLSLFLFGGQVFAQSQYGPPPIDSPEPEPGPGISFPSPAPDPTPTPTPDPSGSDPYTPANPALSHVTDIMQQNTIINNSDAGDSKRINDCFVWEWNLHFQVNADVCIARFIANPLLWFCARILWLAGLIFNYTLSLSLNMTEIINQTPVVTIGWKILRDVANLCFIFILIAIAIGTILQVDSYDVKRLLARVIIVAIILNFSLFATKVIIDASNIIALQFYSKIAPNPTDYNAGISAAFIRGLGLESVYTAGGIDRSNDVNVINENFDINGVNVMKNVIFIGIFGSILMLVTAFVLLVGMILFIIRTIVLMFVMVLSPLAFLAAILPQTKKYFDQWLSALLNQSFFAPLFLLMIYIVIASIAGKYGTGNFAALLAGRASAIPIIYSFVILCGLMLGSLIISKKLGAVGGDFARSTAGKISLGAAGFAGRNTVGRVSKRLQDTAFVKRHAFLESGLNRAATGSFDARNIGVFGKATGLSGSGKGGFSKGFEDKVKVKEDARKRRENRSIGEDMKVIKAENEKRDAEAVYANKLLVDRAHLEENKKPAEELKNQAKIELDAATAHRDAVLGPLTAAIEASRATIQDLETQLRAQEDIVAHVGPGATTAQAEAQRLRGEIAAHQQQIAPSEQLLTDQQSRVETAEGHFQDATNELSKFDDEIKAIDKTLHGINSDYNDNGQNNDWVKEQMEQKYIAAKKYEEKNGLEGLDTAKLREHVNAVRSDSNYTVGKVMDGAKERGRPGISLNDRISAKFGVTTTQMAMARNYRNNARKSTKDRLLDDFAKFAAESGIGGAPATPATPPPPTPRP